MVSTRKLSEITQSTSKPSLADTVVGVSAASVDVRYLLSQIAATVGAANVIESTTEPANPVVGQVWFNPSTNLISIAEVPDYSWSPHLSAGNVALSNSNLTATRSDSTYPNIVTPSQAGATTVGVLPSVQKYIFAITINFTVVDGFSGFGICTNAQGVGNSMFIGSPGSPSPGVAFYPEITDFYYFADNAVPLSHAGSFPNGLYYVAIDPVTKRMWVKLNGGDWNGNAAADPTAGAGGAAFLLTPTTTRVVAQLWRNGDAVTIDPAATGLTLTGFTPISEIVAWVQVKIEDPAGIISIKDFDATGDGVANDGPAFQAFTKAYQNQEVSLYIPPGTYQSPDNTLGLWRGIKRLTIVGYGASLSGSLNAFGGVNDKYGTANSAPVASAYVNDTQLTLINGADASKFTDGDWVMVGALDVEGVGIPPNPHYMEFIQVTTVSGGVVFLDNHLKNGPYLSTYPAYSDNAFGVNEGGPATIWNMTQMFSWWDADFYVYGVTFLAGNDMPALRNRYYKDCQWPGLQSNNWPVTISQGKLITFEDCLIQGGGSIEVDKCVERLTFRNCEIVGYYNALLFQSSSIQQLVIEGSDIEQLAGTPKNTFIRDSWIGTLTPTPRSNGVSESIVIENSYIGQMAFGGWAGAFGGAEDISNYTFSNGTFTKANGGLGAAITWAAPGAKCVFMDATGFWRAPPYFMVLAVRGDGGAPGTGNVHIDTTLESVPTWANGTGPNNLPTLVGQHLYANLTLRNSRGGPRVKMIQPPLDSPSDIGPGFQHGDLVLTGDSTTVSGSPNMKVEGTITSITINVSRAYTGANGAEALVCEHFDIYDNTFTDQNVVFSVDMKTAGIRSWSAGAWTGSVGADALPVIAADDWLFGLTEWHFDNSMAGDNLSQTPIVTVEIVCDPGIVKYPLVDYANSLLNS